MPLIVIEGIRDRFFPESGTFKEAGIMLRPNQTSRSSDCFHGVLLRSAVSGALFAGRSFPRSTQEVPGTN